MHGITQRMLTRTLRHLERDGLVVRHDFEEVVPLWTWIVENVDSFRASREMFDQEHAGEET